MRLNVELDSDYHDKNKDSIRDLYLNKLGITVWRMVDLGKTNVQKKEFPKLTEFMRSIGIKRKIIFDFMKDIKNFAK